MINFNKNLIRCYLFITFKIKRRKITNILKILIKE